MDYRKNSKKKGPSSVQKKKRKSPAEQKREQDAVKEEIVTWITLAVSILLLLSNFGLCGKIGSVFAGVLFGLFGCLEYLLPIFLFIGIVFAYVNRENKVAAVKVIAGILFFFFLCGFVQLFAGKQSAMKFTEVFQYAMEHHSYGGMTGSLILKLLSPFGTGGSVVVLLLLLILSFVIATRFSLLSFFEKKGRKAYRKAQDSSKIHREHKQQKKEAQRIIKERRQEEKNHSRRRVDKKAVGVSFDTDLSRGREHPDMTDQNGTYVSDEMTELSDAEAPSFGKLHQENAEKNKKPETKKNVQEKEIKEQIFEDLYDRSEEKYLQEIAELNEDEKNRDLALADNRKEEEEKRAEETAGAVSRAAKDEKKPHTEERKSLADVSETGAKKDTLLGKNTMQISAERTDGYQFPPMDLLKQGRSDAKGDSGLYLQETAMKLKKTLETFGVKVTVSDVTCGPSVTRYEIQPEMGVKVSRILGLADDIQLNLAASDIRIEAPIPGKAAIGIEIPNQKNVPVLVRDLLESKEFQNHPSNLAFAVGKDIAGKIIVSDIAKMPHLLIAGATGSGKSVCINVLIMGILYKAHPEEVKMIMIDPKVVELSVYNGIPHLMVPVVTDPQKAAAALNWGVAQMDERYRLFSEYGAKNLASYNQKIENIGDDIPLENRPKKLPQILIIVDELADLMMVAKGDVEKAICRLTQLARAAGIHLIIATQRPSVDVITGLIKANMPSRIAFSVSSNVDSRTILDTNGAEKLLGKGDMLFFPQGYQHPARIQGAFVSENEVSDVVSFLLEHHGSAIYDEEVEGRLNSEAASLGSHNSAGGMAEDQDERDVLFVEAGKFVVEKESATIGMLQRVFRIGFNRAARLMDQLAEAGVVGEAEGTKPRKVLMTMEEFEQL